MSRIKIYVNIDEIRDVEVHNECVHQYYTDKLVEFLKREENNVRFGTPKVELKDLGLTPNYYISNGAVYLKPHVTVSYGGNKDSVRECIYVETVEEAIEYAATLEALSNRQPPIRLIELKQSI